MRLILVAPCIALALAAQIGCSRTEHTVAVSPQRGVTSLQGREASLDDMVRGALIAADRQMSRLQTLHDQSTDPVTREALRWEIDALQKHSDVLLDDMSSRYFFVREGRMRNDVAELDLEVDRGTSAEAWALRALEAEPRIGNAERMPRSR